MKRFAIWAGALILVTVVFAALATWGLLRASLADRDGERIVPGLEAAVTVDRDGQGVVTVRGEHYGDVAAALGFVHAQERFFQMDTLRRAAAGEMAALVGEAAVDFDRSRRRWLAREWVGERLAELNPYEREHLAAYTRGVNAGLAALDARPPEYALLRTRPEPWQPEDSLLVALSMFFYLTPEAAGPDRMLDSMAAALPPEVVDFLTDPADRWDAPIVEEAPAGMPPIPSADAFDVRGFEDVDVDAYDRSAGGSPIRGSNSWAVSGRYTDDGRALLAGDMHLGLGLPNTWFRVRLVVSNDSHPTLTGVSLPGTPGIATGSNGRVAWSFTNSYGDWSTRVRLTPGESEDTYQTPEGEQRLESVSQAIEVRGGEAISIDYPWSRWGPVVEDGDGSRHALLWTGRLPGALNLDFGPLYRAESVEQALDAASDIGMPPQNMLAADHEGNIGWTIAGRIPRRGNWARPGERLPESAGFTGVDGWLEGEAYPRVVNPEHGRLWNANARMVNGEALERIGSWGYPFGARQRHIRDRLFEFETFDEAAMLALQLDDEARFLHEWVDLALRAADVSETSPGRHRFRREVAYWHGHAWTASVGYRLIRDFRQAVVSRVLAPLVHPASQADPDFSLQYLKKRERAVRQLLEARPVHLLAPSFEDWDALLADAMDSVVERHDLDAEDTAMPTWGEHNRLRMRHPFSGMLPLSSGWLDMAPVALPGDRDMPRVQRPGFGASQRMVVRPGREEDALFHMPGGQSGHILSPWYDAGHEDWVEGRPSPFLPGETEHELILRPE